MLELWSKLAQQIGSGSRTDVTKPLFMLLVLLLSALIFGQKSGAPTWVSVFLCSSIGAILFLFVAAYIYFGLKDPNLLR
jgi:hypothetical protein